MENFQKRLATMIRSAREAQSLTQDKLGELISVDQSMVGHYERGKGKPRLSTLYLLVRVLGLDVNELKSLIILISFSGSTTKISDSDRSSYTQRMTDSLKVG